MNYTGSLVGKERKVRVTLTTFATKWGGSSLCTPLIYCLARTTAINVVIIKTNNSHYCYSAQNKHKSRSLASLLPSTLRHYISRESLSHPATSTSSPHVHHSQQHSKEATPINTSDSSFHCQQSAMPSQEMSVKGIRFTERSRSFRKPKSHQRSKSADPIHTDRVDKSIVAGAEGHSPQYLHSDPEAERDATSPGNAAGQSSEGDGTSGKCDSESRARVALMNGGQALPQSPNWSYC